MNADYDEMGRELLESLGLTGPRGQAEFNDLDPIWRESTGGCIYVRNEAAARWDGPGGICHPLHTVVDGMARQFGTS